MLDSLKPLIAVGGVIFASGTWFSACEARKVQQELREHVAAEQQAHKSQDEKLDLILRLVPR